MVSRRKNQNLIFIGFQATGKTTISSILSKKMSVPLWDTDKEIIKIHKQTPLEIVKENGIKFFRFLETNVFLNILFSNTGPKIISTGGGIIVSLLNLYVIFFYGTCILLESSVKDIINRIQLDNSNERIRFYPQKSLEEEIQILLKKRSAYYHLIAEYFYNTSLSTIDFIIQDIIKKDFFKQS